jgi:hypothetical protein
LFLSKVSSSLRQREYLVTRQAFRISDSMIIFPKEIAI